MGKKNKKSKNVSNGTDSALEPASAEVVPKERNVGLSEKSKKIKKEKKDKPSAVTAEMVTEAVGNGELQVTTPKKKKKKSKDKQVPVAASEPVETPEEVVVGNGRQTDEVKHKKKKKNKRESDGGEQPVNVSKKIKKEPKDQKPKVIAADNDVVTSESESEGEGADESTVMDKVNQSVLSQHANEDKDSSDDDDDEDKKDNKADSGKEAKKSKRIQGLYLIKWSNPTQT